MKKQAIFARVVVGFFVVIFVSGCWSVNSPRTAIVEDEADTFSQVERVLRRMGYDIREHDQEKGFIQVAAKLDGDTVVQGGYSGHSIGRGYSGGWSGRVYDRQSYFAFEIDETNEVKVYASGFHVKRGKIHNKLKAELEEILTNVGALQAL